MEGRQRSTSEPLPESWWQIALFNGVAKLGEGASESFAKVRAFRARQLLEVLEKQSRCAGCRSGRAVFDRGSHFGHCERLMRAD